MSACPARTIARNHVTQATPVAQATLSPRLARLRQDLEGRDAGALARFWDEIAATGTPLIEPIADDPEGRSRLTFVWRGDAATRTVRLSVLSWPPGRTSDHALRRLEGTDVWYSATHTIRPGHHTTYAFVVNEPADGDPDREQRNRLAVPDPLNRYPLAFRRDPDHPELVAIFGSKWTLSTVVEAGGPPEDPRHQPRGELREERFTSAILGNERWVAIYMPEGCEGARDLWLDVVLDGAIACRIDGRYVAVLDRLNATRKIPPALVVLVDSIHHTEVRPVELRFNPAFADMVATELVPWLASRYPISPDPRRHVICGTSLGGLAAAYTALRHPSAFGNVIAQSPSFQAAAPGEKEPESLARVVASQPACAVRFSLDAGRLEGLVAGTMATSAHPVDIVTATRHFRDVLCAKGYDVHYSELEGAHDFGVWPAAFEQRLLEVMRP